MKVLILGASGATGGHLVDQALARGHLVTALVRDPSKVEVESTALTVMPGDVIDGSSVEAAMNLQEGVLCALGSSTPLKRDPTLVVGVRNVVASMEQAGVRRLIYLSFLGVRDGRHQLSVFGRYLVAPMLLRKVAADHELKEATVQHSSLDWVIVRPPRLTNGPRTGTYRSGKDIGATMIVPRISRADLADFMLDQLISDNYLHQSPAIMY